MHVPLLKMRRPALIRSRRMAPTPLAVRVSDRGEVVAQQRLVTLDLNRTFDTYLPLVAGEAFVRVLEWPHPRGPSHGVFVDALRFEPVTLGRFDVRPSTIDIERVDCIPAFDGVVLDLQTQSDTPVGPIVSGQGVREDYSVTPDAGLSGVDVLTATYVRMNAGPVTFKVVAVRNGADEVLATVTKDAALVQDNQWFNLSFPASGIRPASVLPSSSILCSPRRSRPSPSGPARATRIRTAR